MTRRSGRLLALLEELRAHRRPVTAKQLADKFDVSERTILRDFKVLAELGAPVEGVAGLGFVLGAGFFLPPLALTPLEADAVLLGLRFVQRRGDRDLCEAASGALAKIAGGLEEDRARAMRTNGLAVAPSNSEDGERIGQVRRAIADEHKIEILYRDAGGTETRRIVWPVALAFFDETRILVAWCERREAFRHFRLDRIQSLHNLVDRLPAPRRILLAEYRLEEPEADL
ncbi:WYL domain-containing protein [Breoghania corrubedonensis]|uniref:WYL domain-containing protein n=1 Tax=Breoghania corrubedonensis TaxID=665038 RepID=A0A2T5V4M8_9HYPH|nr:YafY family protein [Breoghania corrubedonensis]PTW58711.1 WYL domain-containing protein [Breoghania corrubedonensis]